jgi:hypothetical protein
MNNSPQETLQRVLGRSRKEIAETARLAGYTVPSDFVERLEAMTGTGLREVFVQSMAPKTF